jgi:nitric oxide reductase NorQ protein
MDLVTVINPKPHDGFVESEYVKNITGRGLRYLKKGFPIHLSGPTGCGKTTLALHIAFLLGRPVVLINGDEEFTTSSLVGGEFGYRKKKVVDRFVSRVYKSDESMTKTWMDDRLTTACKHGFTLIYNEFTRSRPEANNIFLSVLEERMLELPGAAQDGNYIRVHPDFSAIFTSNPEEYAGVFRSQDALMDRMVTISMGQYDEQTEVEITEAKSGVPHATAEKIVRLVRKLRASDICEVNPTLRSCVAIARAVGDDGDATWFTQVCTDVLTPKIGKGKQEDIDPEIIIRELVNETGSQSHS